MSISAMNSESQKRGNRRNHRRVGGRLHRVCALAGIAALCIAVDNLYALFGHGVRSAAMSLMFLYPLGAAALYLLLAFAAPRATAGGRGRLGINLLGSGVATCTVGAFLQGIVEIAGSSCAYLPVFRLVGWGMMTAGVASLLFAAAQRPDR